MSNIGEPKKIMKKEGRWAGEVVRILEDGGRYSTCSNCWGKEQGTLEMGKGGKGRPGDTNKPSITPALPSMPQTILNLGKQSTFRMGYECGGPKVFLASCMVPGHNLTWQRLTYFLRNAEWVRGLTGNCRADICLGLLT